MRLVTGLRPDPQVKFTAHPDGAPNSTKRRSKEGTRREGEEGKGKRRKVEGRTNISESCTPCWLFTLTVTVTEIQIRPN